MKLRRLLRGIVLGVVTILLSSQVVLLAGDPSQLSDADLLEALKKGARAGEYHKKLKTIRADYEQTFKWWRSADAEPHASTSRSTTDRILEGRFVTQNVRGTWLGSGFEGLATMGYDNGTQEYVMTWMDTLSTRIMLSRGTCNDAGDVFTLRGEYYDPIAGAVRKVKIILKILNTKGETLLEMYDITSSDSGFKFLEVNSTRRVRRAA